MVAIQSSLRRGKPDGGGIDNTWLNKRALAVASPLTIDTVASFPLPAVSATMAGMNRTELENLTRQLLAGELELDGFLGRLLAERSEDLGDVTLDLDRRRRCGYPEVIYGEGKTTDTMCRIVQSLRERGTPVLATRVDAEKAAVLCEAFPDAVYNAAARTFRLATVEQKNSATAHVGEVAVVTAGTTDLPVAEEARETLDWMEVGVTMIHDVGVAGPHRLPRAPGDAHRAATRWWSWRASKARCPAWWEATSPAR